jgi:hypothetical protein
MPLTSLASRKRGRHDDTLILIPGRYRPGAGGAVHFGFLRKRTMAEGDQYYAPEPEHDYCDDPLDCKSFEAGVDACFQYAREHGLNNFWRILNGLEPLNENTGRGNTVEEEHKEVIRIGLGSNGNPPTT